MYNTKYHNQKSLELTGRYRNPAILTLDFGISITADFCHPRALGKLPSCFATNCRLFLDSDGKQTGE